MEVSRLGSELKYIEINGVTLNIDERARLELGCRELIAQDSQLSKGASQLYLWGKIRGTIKDYFLVYSLDHSVKAKDSLGEDRVASMPTKCFYWASSSNFVFSSLPQVAAGSVAPLLEIRTLFSGEFDTVLIESSEPAKVIDAVMGIILPPKHLTELDRLAITVREIDRSCSAVPKGALKYTPLHQVLFNEAFKGLSCEDAFELGGWQHFREVENAEQKDLIARHEAIYSKEFLDCIAADKPNFCWSILKDTTQSVAVLRNQLWPGYFGYHRCNTPIYGALYVGDGIANIDLPFML